MMKKSTQHNILNKYMMARCRAEIAPDDITKKTMARGEELASRGRPAQFKLKRKIEYM